MGDVLLVWLFVLVLPVQGPQAEIRFRSLLELRVCGVGAPKGSVLSLARRAKKRDEGEKHIVSALRRIGATVIYCDHPDLIVGYRGTTFLLEVKNPRTPKRLTDSQKELRETWGGGPLAFVSSVEQATAFVTSGGDFVWETETT